MCTSAEHLVYERQNIWAGHKFQRRSPAPNRSEGRMTALVPTAARPGHLAAPRSYPRGDYCHSGQRPEHHKAVSVALGAWHSPKAQNRHPRPTWCCSQEAKAVKNKRKEMKSHQDGKGVHEVNEESLRTPKNILPQVGNLTLENDLRN